MPRTTKSATGTAGAGSAGEAQPLASVHEPPASYARHDQMHDEHVVAAVDNERHGLVQPSFEQHALPEHTQHVVHRPKGE